MEHALGVSVVKRACDRPQGSDHILQLNWAAQALCEGPAFDELQDQVGDSVLLPEVEYVEDVRVLEPGNRPRLLLETLAVHLVLGEEVWQDLDRDVAIQGGVMGLVDGCHPAAPDASHDAVLAEGEPRGQAHEGCVPPTVTADARAIARGRRRNDFWEGGWASMSVASTPVRDHISLGLSGWKAAYQGDELTPQPGDFTYPIG